MRIFGAEINAFKARHLYPKSVNMLKRSWFRDFISVALVLLYLTLIAASCSSTNQAYRGSRHPKNCDCPKFK